MTYRAIKKIELSNGKTIRFGDVISEKEFEALDDEKKKAFLENVYDSGDRGDWSEEGFNAFKV